MTPKSLPKFPTSELTEVLRYRSDGFSHGKEYAVKYHNNQLLPNPAQFKLSCA
jgi:hypothetical protein